MRGIRNFIMMSLVVFMGFGVNCAAECPTADLTGDCCIDLEDFEVMAGQWQSSVKFPEDLVFVTIPSGIFRMGYYFIDESESEQPVHVVTVSSFKMSKHEITNAQYATFLNDAYDKGRLLVGNNLVFAFDDISYFKPYFKTRSASEFSQIEFVDGAFRVVSKGGRSMKNDPVVEVSWYGAKAFCDYYGYYLPTEAQWEYAGRGGSIGKRFPCGETISHAEANYNSYPAIGYDESATVGYHPVWDDGIEPYTAVVGSYAANRFGLCDMAGNAREWCADWWGSYSSKTQKDPKGALAGTRRVVRGGAWNCNAGYCRVGDRISHLPSDLNHCIGFRVCQDIDEPGEADCPSADLNGDCRVDIDDFAMMASQWTDSESLPDGLFLVDIPSVTYGMGDHFGYGQPRERPVHTVRLSAFSISAFETTNAQYAEYLNSAMSEGLIKVVDGKVYNSDNISSSRLLMKTFDADPDSLIGYVQGQFVVLQRDGYDMGDHPVLLVTWYGAKAFCDYYGLRLPTEAEWEYAARGGDKYAIYPWAGYVYYECHMANGEECNPLGLSGGPYTAAVGSYEGNGFGLFDMAGNVWEWCSDWSDYPEYEYYSRSEMDNPAGPDKGIARIIRGGGWMYGDSDTLRTAHRGENPPMNCKSYIGFRVCR